MAKDDYYVIAYKILVYLYACLKRRIIFNREAFYKAIGKDHINEEYLTDVYRMMTKEGLIKGLSFTKAWGDVYVLSTDEERARITPQGIQYLQDNSKMKSVGKALTDNLDIIASLIKLAGIL